MNIKDAYIHNGSGVVKELQVTAAGKLQLKRAEKDANDAYAGWVDVYDLTGVKPTAAGTADKVGHKLTFTGGVSEEWDGSADKTITIPQKSSWNYDDVYVKLKSTEQTIESTLTTTLAKGIVEFYRSSGDHYAMISFANKVSGNKRTLGFIGFKSGNAGQLILRTASGTDYKIWNESNDGSTSGLDADLLDGNHASDFVTSIGTSGNTLTWSKGGTAQTAITVPFATSSTYAANVGASGTENTDFVTAANIISMYNWYNTITADDEAANTAIDKWNEIITFLTGVADTSTLSGLLAGKANSDHTHTWVGDASMKIYAIYNNEVNFGGNQASGTIYIGYRALDEKTIPSNFTFGQSTGTATITAKQFISSATNGTAPLSVTSTTRNVNLNADLLDGYHASNFLYTEQVTEGQANVTWAINYANSRRKAFVYNSNGAEYSYLFGLSDSTTTVDNINYAKYGAILKMGYSDTYLRILRVHQAGWYKPDGTKAAVGETTGVEWEKISAGYADSAGNADTVDNIHANGLLTAASLGTSDNKITLSVTVGGTNQGNSITVPFATNADKVDGYHYDRLLFGWLEYHDLVSFGKKLIKYERSADGTTFIDTELSEIRNIFDHKDTRVNLAGTYKVHRITFSNLQHAAGTFLWLQAAWSNSWGTESLKIELTDSDDLIYTSVYNEVLPNFSTSSITIPLSNTHAKYVRFTFTQMGDGTNVPLLNFRLLSHRLGDQGGDNYEYPYTWDNEGKASVYQATKLKNSRTFTIGSGSATFDGTADVSITLADLGAAATSHNHAASDINSGTFGVARGGTGLSTVGIYSILYASAANTLATLAPNTSDTKKFLRMTGTGSTGAAPAWDTVTKSDVGLSNVENTKLSTWVGSTNITTVGTISSGTWSGTTIAVNKGGTGNTSWTKYGIVYASDTTTLSQISLPTWAASTTYWLKASTNASNIPTYSLATLSKSDVGLENVENTKLSTWAGSSNITTVGTISSGTWHGSTIGVGCGGTGKSSWTQYGIVYASASDTLSQISLPTWAASTTYWLKCVTNASKVPTYSLATIGKADVGLDNVENIALSTWAGSANITTLGTVTTGTWSAATIGVSKGGTGKTSWTKNGIIYASDTTTLSQISVPSGVSKTYLLKCTTNASGTPTYSFDDTVYYKVINREGTWKLIGVGNTSTNYCYIAEINVNRGYANYPITFEIGGRGLITTRVSIKFTNTDVSDPDIDYFVTDNATCFRLKKIEAHVWRLYASSPSDGYWGTWYLYRVIGDSCNLVTIKMEGITTLPESCMSPTYTGNCNYATSAGSATSANSVAWANITGKPDTYPVASHDHDGRYLRWAGNTADVTAMSWGTLTTANGHTILSHASSEDGGDWGMTCKSGQISMQLDGYYYQNEGQYRVTDVSETVTALGTSGDNLTWTKNGSANNITVPYATKATQDGSGNTITSYYCTLDTNQSLTGTKTFSSPGKLVFTTAYDTVLSMVSGSCYANSVLAWNSFHDHFAFLRAHSIVNVQKKSSLDGAWVDDDTDFTALFIHRETGGASVLTPAVKVRRFTVQSSSYHACQIGWLVLGFSYSSPTSKFNLLVEYSEAGSSWTTGFNGDIEGNQTTYTLPLRGLPSNQKYIRFTFTKITNVDTGYVSLNSLIALTPRKGNQGLGREYSFPYDWNASFSIYPIKANQKFGIAGSRWEIYGTSGDFSSSVTASSFVKSGSTDDYILLGGGGTTTLASVGAYAIVSNNATSYNLSRDTWVNTIDLPTDTGSYILYLTTGNSTLTGVFSIGTSDNAKDEISLHLHGNGTRLYARTNGSKLQLSSNYTPTQSNPTQSTSVVIKYKRMI